MTDNASYQQPVICFLLREHRKRYVTHLPSDTRTCFQSDILFYFAHSSKKQTWQKI